MKIVTGLLFLILLVLVFHLNRGSHVRRTDTNGVPEQAPVDLSRPANKGKIISNKSIHSEPIKLVSRIFTNGVLSLAKLGAESEYDEKVRKHVQLRAVINSSVRDTDECVQIAEILSRNSYGLDLLPMAYSYSWQHGDLQRRFPNNPDNSMNPERHFRTGMLETDFKTHLERTYGRVSQELIGELLTVVPEKSFGWIDTTVRENEPLYEDINHR